MDKYDQHRMSGKRMHLSNIEVHSLCVTNVLGTLSIELSIFHAIKESRLTIQHLHSVDMRL